MEEIKSSRVAHAEVKSDINVTPLVDVCLVMLIIFMVVTPLLQTGIDIPLPETGKPDQVQEGKNQLLVAIKQDGTIFMGQNWVRKEDFGAAMKDLFAQAPDKDVRIKGDRRLAYKDVREVMQMVNAAGFTKAGLITTKKGKTANEM